MERTNLVGVGVVVLTGSRVGAHRFKQRFGGRCVVRTNSRVAVHTNLTRGRVNPDPSKVEAKVWLSFGSGKGS